MQRSFNAGFESGTKLDAPTSSFGMSPRTCKIALCNALVPDLSYCHRADPGLLVQRNKSSAHECTVGCRGGDSLLSHSTQSAISCLNSLEALLYQTKQFLIMTALKLLGPALPLILRARASRSLEVQSVGNAVGTLLYCSNVMQSGSPRLGILVLGCCDWSTSITSHPVLVQAS
jgi:hypothetical protein